MKLGNKEVSLIKIILIILLVSLIAFVIYIVIKSNMEKTSIDDFKTSKEVIEYLDSKFISRTTQVATYPVKINLKFKYLPYNEDNTSNENYYNQMIYMIAKVEKYSNFILSDSENDITVKVECEFGSNKITNININDKDNYFVEKNNELTIDNYTKINNVDVNIKSSELNELIKNNWKYNEGQYGTIDSVFNNYDLYFDEGIEVRKIENQILDRGVNSNRVFNIVFTSKYKNEILNNIYTNNSLEEVINILGQPHYGNLDSGLIGYRTDKFYIFMNSNKQISIYRYENPDKSDFAKIVSLFINEKNSTNLISKVMNLWPDYDNYNEDSSNNSKYLLYTLYGIKIQFNVSNEHGIILYNNYSGKVTEDINFDEIINKSKTIPKYIYVKDTNLVYENEQTRIYSLIPDFNATK